MGDSALDSGLAVSPRGLGSLVAMLIVGVLVNYQRRILLALGFAGFGYLHSAAQPHQSRHLHVVRGLQTSSMVRRRLSLRAPDHHDHEPSRKQEIGNAAGIYNLMRNIGGSIGIAAVTAFWCADPRPTRSTWLPT